MLGSVESEISRWDAPMKLILSQLETVRTYVTREFYYIQKELMSTYGWEHIEICDLWDGARTVRDKLMHEFWEIPEAILFWQAYEFLNAQAADMRRLDSRNFFLPTTCIGGVTRRDKNR